MESNLKNEILLKINKIENPVLLSELNLFLDEWQSSSSELSNLELNASINRALAESEAGLGVKHEEIWSKLKSA
jgi:hypothetical protein